MHWKFAVRAVLLAILVTCVSGALHAQVRVGVAITVAPPPLPVYEQPLCPGDGYLWTPGYWDYDYDASDYFWVPGTWVLAPEVGFLWTPPWWGWGGSGFVFTAGYWGPVVGFYGGINYGFGYFGTGFYGGRWEGGHFFYNTTINHVDVTVIHNVYNERINEHITESRVSYNGHGGIDARPTPAEEAAARERHIGPVAAQTEHVQAARGNRELRYSANHGNPSIAATEKPGDFSHNVVRAGEGNRAEGNASRHVVHPNDLPATEHMAAPNTGDAKQDAKIQKQQDQLYQKQQQERQKLQAQQDKEHQQADRQHYNQQRQEEMEQRHAEQTRQLQERQSHEMERMSRSFAPRGGGGHPR